MSLKDKEKWDAKYLRKKQLLIPREASHNLQNFIEKVKGDQALDLACGSGRHALYLARKGFYVDALDIASIALEALDVQAKIENLATKINTKLVDLDTYSISPQKYDLILMTNYLHRALLKQALEALKVGGIIFVETYMQSNHNEKKNSDIQNLLQPKELKNMLDERWEVVHYEEFDNEGYEIYKMKKQVIIAKKLSL